MRAKALQEIDKKKAENKPEGRFINDIMTENGQISVEKTEQLLKNINNYLETEKDKLNNN